VSGSADAEDRDRVAAPCASAGLLYGFAASTSAPPGDGQSYCFNLVRNGEDEGVSMAIRDGATSGGAADGIEVARGDLICWHMSRRRAQVPRLAWRRACSRPALSRLVQDREYVVGRRGVDVAVPADRALGEESERVVIRCRVYSANVQSLCRESVPTVFHMIATIPTKSFPGRTASLTTIVTSGYGNRWLPSGAISSRGWFMYTFFSPLCGSEVRGGIGAAFSLSHSS